MKGVVLVNMGGPRSEQEVKTFLSRMFNDPFILPYGKLGRALLAFIISSLRFKKSWKKYQLIGGTPIITSTEKTVDALQSVLGKEYLVTHAFSYSEPFVRHALSLLKDHSIREILVIPMYPQSSFTTTGSVVEEVTRESRELGFDKICLIPEFYSHSGFIAFWSKNISDHLKRRNLTNPLLLFSAHSIPKYLIDQGDTYSQAISGSAALIASSLGCSYEVTYQSGMKRGEWIGPDTKVRLQELASSGKSSIVLIPISFLHENLETLYDLDLDIVPFGATHAGIENISRVTIPEVDPLLVQLLAELIHEKDVKEI